MTATPASGTTTTSAPAESRSVEQVEGALRAALSPQQRPTRVSALSASLTFGWRALLKIKYVPEQLFDVTAFPVMMTLMFTYLFGGAVAGSTGEYLQFFLPGILVVSVVMITMYTGVTLNNDITKGVFDRFRSLPIWRPAAIVGALLGDAVRYTLASVVILGLGLILGFRPEGGVVGVVAGVLLLLVFSFSLSWAWTLLGLVLRTEKAVMGAAMMLLFPLTFGSNVYVDPETMPSWLESTVNMNPITHLVSAVRNLMQGESASGDVLWVLVASVVLVAIFGPLTMHRYRTKS